MGKKLLIIEDQPEIRQLYATAFGQRGYEIVQAGNGLNGFEQAAQGGFSAILTDLKMPGMDGLELLGKLKETKVKPTNGPIFVISSVTYPFAKDEVLRRGANGFILKDSMNIMEVVELVEAAIAKK